MITLEGAWNCKLDDGTKGVLHLPGTLDESGLGHNDTGANQWHPDAELGNAGLAFDANAPIATRLTRKYTFEGSAEISRTIAVDILPEKRYFVYVERARELQLFVNGESAQVFEKGTTSTPWIFEITNLLENGDNDFVFVSDNSYPSWPKEDILNSSAATDETQTNWNGLLGRIELIDKPYVFIKDILLKKNKDGYYLDAQVDGENKNDYKVIYSSAAIDGNHVNSNIEYWDEYEGNLYDVQAELVDSNGVTIDKKTISFGIREVASVDGHLTLNNRKIFLRGETNSAQYPETGYLPMTEDAWDEIFNRYISYGINFVRFHSHCPPEAAFVVADKKGIMLQPELSNWNPKNAFSSTSSKKFYELELKRILQYYNRHPSFVLFSLGNELWADEIGHDYMDYLVNYGRELDSTRLYINGSNAHYGTIGCDVNSDFYESQSWKQWSFRGTSAGEPTQYNGFKKGETSPIPLQGYINNTYPSTKTNYDESLKQLRQQYDGPVIGFETGQYEMLPDFDELEEFKGITKPVNYEIIRDRAKEKHLEDCWKLYVEATGELALLAYKEEIEAALRTAGLSGTILLSLQDFAGQGTALVGMMNAHLKPKPYSFANPKRFKAFCQQQHLMVLMDRYTYWSAQILNAKIQIANYGKTDLYGTISCGLYNEVGEPLASIDMVAGNVKPGESVIVGEFSIQLPKTVDNLRCNLVVSMGALDNTYPIWIYAEEKAICPKNIYYSNVLNEKVLCALKEGKSVLLEPECDLEHLPQSIGTQFTTDFWSVGTFSRQEGSMGQLIDFKHPIFKDFPTEFHTNWQWYIMAKSRATIVPSNIKPLITEIDSYAYMRHMAQLFECKCLNGKLMFSTMELYKKTDYPEANALLNCIYKYMESDLFAPKQTISLDELKAMTY